MSAISNNISILEYIWIDGNYGLRSKSRVQYSSIYKIEDIPIWNFDGSSTNQACIEECTEVIIRPCAFYKNPLLKPNNENVKTYLVICDTYDTSGNPLSTNSRVKATNIFNKKPELKAWFGLEQEYYMKIKQEINNISVTFDHYCGTTKMSSKERIAAEEHMLACIDAGLNISGINAEVGPQQWEYQIGPCENISAGDQLIVARFLMERIAEKHNMDIIYYPKVYIKLSGSGCHVNFSTTETRCENGIEKIMEYIGKLQGKHIEHIKCYGVDNDKRLTGLHETSNINEFSYGIGTRNTSIRIPNNCVNDGCGYIEDRRPAANMDPYIVTSKIFETCCL